MTKIITNSSIIDKTINDKTVDELSINELVETNTILNLSCPRPPEAILAASRRQPGAQEASGGLRGRF